MTERGMESAGEEEERRARRRRITVGIVVAVLVLLLVQSITITLPIHARVVDARSGEPVAGARVAALWSLRMATPHSHAPGGAVRIAHATTDPEGKFELPLAFIVHPPVAPFSLLLRSDADMPLLIVVARGYRENMEFNDVFGMKGPSHPPGFLSIRSSSLENSTIGLTPLHPDVGSREIEQEEIDLSAAERQVADAQSSCRRRTMCISESVNDILHVIKLRREEIRKQGREQSREQGNVRRERQGLHASIGGIDLREFQ